MQSGGIDIISDFRGSGPDGTYQAVNDIVQNNTIIHNGDTALDGIAMDQAPLNGSAWGGNVFNNNSYDTSGSGQHWMFYSPVASGSGQMYGVSGLQSSGLPFDQNSTFNVI